jgi:hypothetical protein
VHKIVKVLASLIIGSIRRLKLVEMIRSHKFSPELTVKNAKVHMTRAISHIITC